MGEYHITIKAGRGLFVALGIIIFIMTAVAAGAICLFLVYDPLDKISLRVSLEQQDLKARMAASFPVVAEVDQLLRVPLDDTISIEFPFNQHFAIPFNKTLDAPVELNTTIPVYMTVPFKSDIPIDTKVFVDADIKTTFMGIPITVPVKGYIPVRATIPVEQQVTVQEDLQLALRAPVKVDIKDTFQISINTMLSAKIPLKTELTIPFKEHVLANVSLEGDEAQQIPNLHLMNNTMDLKLNQMRLIWKSAP